MKRSVRKQPPSKESQCHPPYPIHNPHDRFFRAAMAQKQVAIDFFNHHLPDEILQALDIDSVDLDPSSHIDHKLKERLSDLIFTCNLADKPACLALLIEHQSEAEKLLPFRVHSYLFRLLESREKRHPDQPLPAVYAMVFYQGERSPYPYSLSLWDCFEDPLQLMPKVLYQPIPLIDVNQLSDKELKQQAWVGPMARALKHARELNVAPYLLDILEDMQRVHGPYSATGYIKLLINYLLSVGQISDPKGLFKDGYQRLSKPIRSEIMAGSKTLGEWYKEEWLQKGRQEVALKMLKEGADYAFVSKVTNIPVKDLKNLQPSK